MGVFKNNKAHGSSINLNTDLFNEFVVSGSVTNAPSTGEGAWLVVDYSDPDNAFKLQLASSYNGNALYSRIKWSGTWKDWRNLG